jgi:nucleoside-diphosphate-sugar epimerase
MAGPWQRALARSRRVVHLAQPLTFGGKVTRRRAEAYRARRLVMDRRLLEAISPETERVVYVGGTSYYGNLGVELCDEDATPSPCGWGPYVAPAIEALGRYLERGLRIVTAFPGVVYGDGSWFRSHVLRPLAAGKRMLRVGGPSRWCSPIHVDDCARALVHLAEAGEVGRRYFVVDDRPVPFVELAERAAGAMQVPLRFLRVPVFVARLVVGPVVIDSLQADAVLSNARLRGLGFRCQYPSVEEGIPEVVTRWRDGHHRPALPA